MKQRLERLEKKFEEQIGGEYCPHAGDVQIIETEPDGTWEH
jgi:hypothetical protein